MKYISMITVLVFTAVTSSLAQATPPACGRFKTGNFLFTDSAGITWEIERGKAVQKEKNQQSGVKIRLRIEWLDDCTYKLTQIWSSDATRKKLNNTSVTYTIISAEENMYKYRCSCADKSQVTGTVVKQPY